jgi:hypothetical protein
MLEWIGNLGTSTQMNWEILSYAAALLTALIGWYLAESVRKNNQANEASTLTGAALQLVNYKDKEIEILRSEIFILKLYLSHLVDEIHKTHKDFDALSLEEFKTQYDDK